MRGVEFRVEDVRPGDVVKMSNGKMYRVKKVEEVGGGIKLIGYPCMEKGDGSCASPHELMEVGE